MDTPKKNRIQKCSEFALIAVDVASEALAVFERGRKLEPGEPEWLFEYARSARALGEFENGVTALTQWLRTEPDDLEQRKDLAKLCVEMERFAQGEQLAREAVDIDPADTDVQDTLLLCLNKQGKKDEAERWRRLFGRAR